MMRASLGSFLIVVGLLAGCAGTAAAPPTTPSPDPEPSASAAPEPAPSATDARPSCHACACEVVAGGCANLCDNTRSGLLTPNFCNGTAALPNCAACIQSTCGGDPSACD